MLRLEDVERISKFRAGELSRSEAEVVRNKLGEDPDWRLADARLNSLDELLPVARRDLFATVSADRNQVASATDAVLSPHQRHGSKWRISLTLAIGCAFVAGLLVARSWPDSPAPIVGVAPTQETNRSENKIVQTALDAGSSVELPLAATGAPPISTAKIDPGPQESRRRNFVFSSRTDDAQAGMAALADAIFQRSGDLESCGRTLSDQQASARFSIDARYSPFSKHLANVQVDELDPGNDPFASSCGVEIIKTIEFAKRYWAGGQIFDLNFPIRFLRINKRWVVVPPILLTNDPSPIRGLEVASISRTRVPTTGMMVGAPEAKRIRVYFINASDLHSAAMLDLYRHRSDPDFQLIMKHFPKATKDGSGPDANNYLQGAYDQGRFWDFLTKMYELSPQFPGDFTNIALGMNLDLGAISKQVDQYWSPEIRRDIKDAAALGLYGPDVGEVVFEADR